MDLCGVVDQDIERVVVMINWTDWTGTGTLKKTLRWSSQCMIGKAKGSFKQGERESLAFYRLTRFVFGRA